MLKVVTPDEMRSIEQQAIRDGTQNGLQAGIQVETLMESAGKETADVIVALATSYKLPLKAFVVAGKGNNGGDGYVVARHLLQHNFQVQVVQAMSIEPTSLVKKQRRRFEARGGKVLDLDHNPFQLPNEGIIVDALFGTGFQGKPDERIGKLINEINASSLPVIAVDVPSGLNAATGEVEGECIQATITCTMELPKLGFFIGSGWNVIGKLIVLPIGLKAASEIQPGSLYMIDEQDVANLLPPIVRSRHKYQAGDVVGFAGTHGMSGAALMSSLGALKSGAGIVHLLHDEAASPEFANSPLEVVRIPYTRQELGIVRYWIDRASALFLGPGLGTENQQEALLEALWPNVARRTVLDADALTWIASKMGKRFGPLPEAILTPHLGELHRILQTKEAVGPTLLQQCQELVDANQTHLVLKGGPTFLFSYDKPALVMPRGDPGMATAGSGDVLTGVLSALLAQGLEPHDAMKLGTFLHGVAGELAAIQETSYSMTAISILNHLPNAFSTLLKEKVFKASPWQLSLKSQLQNSGT